MSAIYRIHPGIGIARLGDSPHEFCISPEAPAALPIACDSQGNPLRSPDGESVLRIQKFKDAAGRIKRQAARFQVYVYDEKSPDGRPLELGDPVEGGGNNGTLQDIQWRVYLANKKSSWYEFKQLQGEHGYAPGHPRRNADVAGSEARQRLIIDPGPRIVNAADRRSASFSRDSGDAYAATFPPPDTRPHAIDTLGELKTDDLGRLLVLGGHGCSGSSKRGFGHPRIEHYANNDGWFDDTSDGPVMARLVMYSKEVEEVRFIDVEYPAWVIVGYPAYVPQILDLITLDDLLYDLAIREFAKRTDLYGKPGTYGDPEKIDPTDTKALVHWKAGGVDWNPTYKPWFYRDVWPILFRPDEFTYLTDVLQLSNYPHNQSQRGTFDPEELSKPPFRDDRALAERCRDRARDNQSGALFVQALGPTLAILEREAEQAVRSELQELEEAPQQTADPSAASPSMQGTLGSILRMGALGDVAGPSMLAEAQKSLADALRAAAADFADTVADEAATDDPGAYLAGWQAASRRGGEAYRRARRAFEEAVEGALSRFGEDRLEKWSLSFAELTRRMGEDAPGDLSQIGRAVSETIETELIERFEKHAAETARSYTTGALLEKAFREAEKACTYDPYRPAREFLYKVLRRPGEENEFNLAGKPNNRLRHLPLMPLLAGDNPIDNTLTSKFLRLTEYQLYVLRQWADGHFYNEFDEGWVKGKPDPFHPYRDWPSGTACDLDRGVLSNLLGGAFCPGGEVGWIMRNPSIYEEPYRIKADPDFYAFRQTAADASARRGKVRPEDYTAVSQLELDQDDDFERGMQPGDLTKHMALPWQSDFNECTTQPIDLTYEGWNKLEPENPPDPRLKLEEREWETLWWPAHRPLQTNEVTKLTNGKPATSFLNWARGVPQTPAGDLKMVTEWSRLGFVMLNPYLDPKDRDTPSALQPPTKYISVERSSDEE